MITIVNIDVLKLIKEFNEKVDYFQRIIYYTRNIKLQKETLEELKKYAIEITSFKNSNSNFLEQELNLIAFFELLLSALISELKMIIALKNDKMDIAWACLIKAQTEAQLAASNHPINSNQLEGYLNKLNMYEKSLFPELAFASIGGIIKEALCSICKKDYNDCEHMKGKLYKGELCVREITNIELEEASIVSNPASKLNRILTTTFKGETVDVLSFKKFQ